MSTDIAVVGQSTSLAEQMDFARYVTASTGGSILPESYRGNPANVLIAVGLGQSMGLSPAESLYRISVIKGKPSAGAELIAANVRRAGHKLRVRGDDQSCTATIVRADDPDYEFTVTRDMSWATRMGLAGQDNYKKQPGTMLQWRAITACARLACPEALYGVTYTPDELGEVEPDAPTPTRARGMAAVRQAVQTGDPAPDLMTDAQRGKLFALLGEAGITTPDTQRAYISNALNREVTSRAELTKADAAVVIDMLEADVRGADEQGA